MPIIMDTFNSSVILRSEGDRKLKNKLLNSSKFWGEIFTIFICFLFQTWYLNSLHMSNRMQYCWRFRPLTRITMHIVHTKYFFKLRNIQLYELQRSIYLVPLVCSEWWLYDVYKGFTWSLLKFFRGWVAVFYLRIHFYRWHTA